jgi:hypothetical protein
MHVLLQLWKRVVGRKIIVLRAILDYRERVEIVSHECFMPFSDRS